MLTVKKDNRVLNIDELEKVTFLEDGYDVVEVRDGEYVVVEPATGGRTYTIQEYRAVVAERDQALAERDNALAELDKLAKKSAKDDK
ncbi:hypothetical protein smi_0453 [Streptococcus mitis B6]|uniref:Phage protein n=1 Tax=Streptococcus mitis (strain B6) TaxID=365659 RepID=D3H783_STRM6|nr:hypothetical protein [Streptococcus mitis]QBX26212.1 hypothetical protein Javan308_0043 [Streptococcus phage Javan308]CBJ21725.1 hypothetical protein smi_0453 [Streptococcus mitis B6]